MLHAAFAVVIASARGFWEMIAHPGVFEGSPRPGRGRDPRVSIGLPVFNGSDYLAESVDSLLTQTYTDFELLIFDNASTDRTPEICAAYAERDPRVVYHRQPENIGAARNYNEVFHAARGELFKWAAHDDLCEPTYLERCVEVFDAEGDAVTLVYPQTLFVGSSNEPIDRYVDGMDLRDRSALSRFRTLLKNLSYCNAVFGLIRTADLRRTSLIGAYPASDRLLLAELALLGRFVEVPEVLFRRRMHEKMSNRANRTDADVAAWFDPKTRGKRLMPRCRLFAEHARAAIAAPLPMPTRLACELELCRVWLPKHWRVMAGECKARLRSGLGRAKPAPTISVSASSLPDPVPPPEPIAMEAADLGIAPIQLQPPATPTWNTIGADQPEQRRTAEEHAR